MSKVIIFSRFFPAYHPRKGEPTFFVEKMWTDLFWQHIIDNNNMDDPLLEEEIKNFYTKTWEGKSHTIRAGNRWKVGDWFSPRVWSGKPYNSKQILLTPPIEVKAVYHFKQKNGVFYLNHKKINIQKSDIPVNDGLSTDDFIKWFRPYRNFEGQIICWNKEIKY